jgi:hypothetical protein
MDIVSVDVGIPEEPPTDELPDLSLGEAVVRAGSMLGAPLWDRVDQPSGPTLAVLDSIYAARQRLRADVERCRYVILPGHRCANREGAPLNEGQVCWHEARAQLREADCQPREQAVPCRGCRSATWHRDAVCDECREARPDAAAIAAFARAIEAEGGAAS